VIAVRRSGLRVIEGCEGERVVVAVEKVATCVPMPARTTPQGWVTVSRGVQYIPTTGRYRARATAPGGKRVSAGLRNERTRVDDNVA
jgi:hypothetical protein